MQDDDLIGSIYPWSHTLKFVESQTPRQVFPLLDPLPNINPAPWKCTTCKRNVHFLAVLARLLRESCTVCRISPGQSGSTHSRLYNSPIVHLGCGPDAAGTHQTRCVHELAGSLSGLCSIRPELDINLR